MNISTGAAIFAIGIGFLVQGLGWLLHFGRFVSAFERLVQKLK